MSRRKAGGKADGRRSACLFLVLAAACGLVPPAVAEEPRAAPAAVPAAVMAPAASPAAATASVRDGGTTAVPTEAARAAIAERWGIEPVAVRLVGRGTMLDFRFRVLDPAKSLPLFNRELKPALVDQDTNLGYPVPDVPKIGQVRPTPRNPAAGKTYFIFFANVGGQLKRGSRVAVVVGPCTIRDLVVE